MRHEWVRQRLDNWARWVLESDHHGLGYPRQAPFARMRAGRVDADASFVAVVPIDQADAAEVNREVRALQLTRSNLYLAICCRYVGDPRTKPNRRRPMSVAETAQAMCMSESTVKAYALQAIEVLAVKLSERRRNVQTSG